MEPFSIFKTDRENQKSESKSSHHVELTTTRRMPTTVETQAALDGLGRSSVRVSVSPFSNSICSYASVASYHAPTKSPNTHRLTDQARLTGNPCPPLNPTSPAQILSATLCHPPHQMRELAGGYFAVIEIGDQGAREQVGREISGSQKRYLKEFDEMYISVYLHTMPFMFTRYWTC